MVGEKKEVKKNSNDEMLDAIKELTTAVADMAKKLENMHAEHVKWIRSGKF